MFAGKQILSDLTEPSSESIKTIIKVQCTIDKVFGSICAVQASKFRLLLNWCHKVYIFQNSLLFFSVHVH